MASKTKIKSNGRATVSTYAPLFGGFYNTWEQAAVSEHLASMHCDCDAREDGDYSACECDFSTEQYRTFETGFAKSFLAVLEADATAKAINLRFELQSVYSPKEYNFSTDAIYCAASFDVAPFVAAVLSDAENLERYLHSRYTSRDGFISSYTNDLDDWRDALLAFAVGDAPNWFKPDHCIGAMLEFYFQAADIADWETRYYAVSEKFENSCY